VLELAELELDRGVPGLDDRVVQRRANPAHRLGDPHPDTGRPEVVRGVLAALVGMHDHLAEVVLAAADRDRHP
jgi:hypothetical protein